MTRPSLNCLDVKNTIVLAAAKTLYCIPGILEIDMQILEWPWYLGAIRLSLRQCLNPCNAGHWGHVETEAERHHVKLRVRTENWVSSSE